MGICCYEVINEAISCREIYKAFGITKNNTKNVLLDLSTNLEQIGLPRFQLFVKTLIYNYFNEKTKLLKKINAIDFSTNIEVYTDNLEKLFKENP